ncbi:MAG: sec-independent protein translocase protein TatA [Thermoplasmata archaeon]|jgi:sec-independent protein translocase protein TatA|nr:sec-independent protein translocase protein TatA [Thermoplasmata archaeon]
MVLGLGTQELVIVVVVVLLLFGATAIPKLARSLGRAQGEFKKAKTEFDAELRKSSATAPVDGPSEEQVRRSARDLGIDEAGKPLDEVKRLIAQKLA